MLKATADMDNALAVNNELRRLLECVEILPLGLAKERPFDLEGRNLGKKPNRDGLYGNKFPAFRLIFKNGVTRTIVYHRFDPDLSLCVWSEGDKHFIDFSYLGLPRSKNASSEWLNSKEFSKFLERQFRKWQGLIDSRNPKKRAKMAKKGLKVVEEISSDIRREIDDILAQMKVA